MFERSVGRFYVHVDGQMDCLIPLRACVCGVINEHMKLSRHILIVDGDLSAELVSFQHLQRVRQISCRSTTGTTITNNRFVWQKSLLYGMGQNATTHY